MIRVDPADLRRAADGEDLAAEALVQLLADTRPLVGLAEGCVGDAQSWLNQRMELVRQLIGQVAANHHEVARGLRRAAEVYSEADHPRPLGDGRMAR